MAHLAMNFLGSPFRKAGKAVRPGTKEPVRSLAEGALNQFGDLPTTVARTVPISLVGRQHALLYPGIEGDPLGTAGSYGAGGDEYPCGTCADGSVMWCD